MIDTKTERHIPQSEPFYECEFGQCRSLVDPKDMFWNKGHWVCKACATENTFLGLDVSSKNGDTLVNYLIEHGYTYTITRRKNAEV